MKNLLKLCFLSLVCFSLAACFAGKTMPQSKYLLAVKLPKQVATQTTKSLYVQQLSSVPQFATNEFVYRLSQFRYEPDYYHVFLVPAAEQLTQVTKNYLLHEGLFNFASSSMTPMEKANYLLTGKVLAMYADYQAGQKPAAVLRVRYNFYHQQKGKEQVLFSQVFSVKVPLQEKSTSALLQAWNQAAAKLLQQLTMKINASL